MSDQSNQRASGAFVFNNIVRFLFAASLLIVMSAIYQHDSDGGSHYIHPRRAMQ
ncbi:uncharacterized protein Dwil_GK19614 [Drosophila willistoni]|uniref:Uncharacterized protein n=1 Tax=Drosophila willistoni TaxID=7260 RepID=B4MNN5_DROWI|nr:uncharacterized protein LOC6639781 [Drosophila willistoni]EDW73724.1 uncharacterized protein Dwil_GK19614 [Drosophila willistoni]